MRKIISITNISIDKEIHITYLEGIYTERPLRLEVITEAAAKHHAHASFFFLFFMI